MTEIKIEKKKSVWPWLIVIIVIIVLVLLYFFVFKNQSDDFDNSNQKNTEQIDTMDSTMDAGEDTPVWEDNQISDSLTGGSTELTSAYLSSIEDKSKLGSDATYTKNALIRLIDAVRAKANESQLNLDTNLKEVRKNMIETSAGTTNISSKQIKEAGNKIVAAMQKIQKKKYPGLTDGVKKVKNAVDHIDTKKKMDNQHEQIKTFFEESSDVLKQMN